MAKEKLRLDVLTLFPNFFKDPLSTSLISRAIKSGILNVQTHNIRDFGVGKHKQVDDRPFGGGPGMVLKPDVLASSLKSVVDYSKEHSAKIKPYVVLLDPAGNLFSQKKARNLAGEKWLVLICGHYEGVDERFKEEFVDEEISIGDYILTGGEPAALVVIDSVSRLLPGFLGKKESALLESFNKVKVKDKNLTLLDYPVYTRPETFENKRVPDTLLTGNHKKIEQWRLDKSLEKTKQKRPDLLKDSSNT
ncbi:MAG: tRNA (guanosine(37)-N1)-methyltransferase TrmD [Candidatus Woykebacteria bacterium RBG_16_43_9]|uniref:tRNA (guanine-N(1)-)-methyltransferase n=1 Tax=Candidatus Woykebacteria bacterium RBG_16_43_9 TaxID=1802596 RepID=A0A1G1WF44_9BACT|nr:MAG: tRNA (guanosine(37)-N1)-methyltransferase TrmD [Candidatus Woykebacteria bacterium RBG_16_43_9]